MDVLCPTSFQNMDDLRLPPFWGTPWNPHMEVSSHGGYPQNHPVVMDDHDLVLQPMVLGMAYFRKPPHILALHKMKYDAKKIMRSKIASCNPVWSMFVILSSGPRKNQCICKALRMIQEYQSAN